MKAHIPRKRFGQNFLQDQGVIGDIVSCIDPKPSDPMVEIGPGLAALTAPLLDKLDTLHVVEIDRDIVSRLTGRFAPGKLHIHNADALTFDFGALASQLAPGGKIRLVGNLPYNISTPILFHLLAVAPLVRDQHFMLQKEVVDRMAAGPGGKVYGRLSVMLQWRYAIDSLMDVPPESFDPPPRVDSAIVRMVPLAQPPVLDEARLQALVTVAFSQRRKLLRHSLGRWLDDQGFAGEFDLQRRAEEVPVAEYVKLAQHFGVASPA
jgi:16S rRNA (adenine1518-N6/adenine1519-N6)-dimethyltransferase